MTLRRLLVLAATLLIGTSPVFGLTLPHVFGDHMMLAIRPAGAGLGLGWAGRDGDGAFRGPAEADDRSRDGRWAVRLDPLAISARPAELEISGSETVVFKDVLVGEVWLCAGQSNMQKPLGTWRGQPIATVNYLQELAAADFPLLRLMNEEISNADAPAPISTSPLETSRITRGRAGSLARPRHSMRSSSQPWAIILGENFTGSSKSQSG